MKEETLVPITAEMARAQADLHTEMKDRAELAERLLKEAEKALESIQARLVVAHICMEDGGHWRNSAGRLTDAALWIGHADRDAESALSLLRSSDRGSVGTEGE